MFHNGSIYDYHFTIKELVKEFEGNFECLGDSTEKYITFSVPIKKKIENKDLEITYKIKFIDSYRFMASSLSKLVYPHEYMNNWERFNETSLPSKESFYSNLNMEDIDDIDYRHGNNVFNKFKLNNLGDYHDLYVQSDTLLLADVFENFRDMCLKEYELDPAHFLSLPGLAWQACLKKTNIELELLTDYDMLLMVE